MKTPIMKMFCAVTALILVTPFTTYAYKTTGQSVTKINDSYALFTIDYTFGFLNRETYLPIVASRGKTAATNDLEYEILGTDNQILKGGVVTALILSGTTIEKNQYYLPKGKNGSFKLVVLLRLDETLSQRPALQITDIPLVLEKDSKKTLTTFPTESFATYRTNPL